ncbi:MAG: hypothetical protein FJ098_16410 [Deltaproteobacteria bacterium]|nr:hypothetical protein [Deltaproteobacteria bacterium]
MLALLERHEVRYLIIGGYAFSFHAFPRFTKNLDLWVDPDVENVGRVNKALAEFGSPVLLDPSEPVTTIVQIGIAPNRIDILRTLPGVDFATAWESRIRSKYGDVTTNWMDLRSLILSKRASGRTRDEADAGVLESVESERPR